MRVTQASWESDEGAAYDCFMYWVLETFDKTEDTRRRPELEPDVLLRLSILVDLLKSDRM